MSGGIAITLLQGCASTKQTTVTVSDKKSKMEQTTQQNTTQEKKEKETATFPQIALEDVVGEENVLQMEIKEDSTPCDLAKTYYQICVETFVDSDGDGVGDIMGIINRLDYIKDLGCDGICIMAAKEKETSVAYKEELQPLLAAAKEKEMKVILEIELYSMYTSFLENATQQDAKQQLQETLQLGIENGADGYYVTDCDGMLTDNAEEDIALFQWVKECCQKEGEDPVIIVEVWKSFQKYQQYYKSGVDSFVLSQFSGTNGTIARNIRKSSGNYAGQRLANEIVQTQETVKQYRDDAKITHFLTNEKKERRADFLYGNENETKFAGAINLLMSGNAILYYGEELGLKSTVLDDFGGVCYAGSTLSKPQELKEPLIPMYWTAKADKKNIFGLTKLEQEIDTIDLFGSYEEQMSEPLSIYNYYRRILQIRRQIPAIANGQQKVMDKLDNTAICGLLKTYQKEEYYVLMNVSSEEQIVKIPKTDYFYQKLLAGVGVDENEVILEGETLLLPPYAIAVLK